MLTQKTGNGLNKNKKILIDYNELVSIYTIYKGKRGAIDTDKNDLSYKGFSEEIEYIKSSLSKYYDVVETLAITKDIESTIYKIDEFKPDVIYNFVESIEGIASYEYCIACIYELLGYEYTGSTTQTLGHCLNKSITKNIIRAFNINTTKSIIISNNTDLKDVEY